jgi:hypothetical protein
MRVHLRRDGVSTNGRLMELACLPMAAIIRRSARGWAPFCFFSVTCVLRESTQLASPSSLTSLSISYVGMGCQRTGDWWSWRACRRQPSSAGAREAEHHFASSLCHVCAPTNRGVTEQAPLSLSVLPPPSSSIGSRWYGGALDDRWRHHPEYISRFRIRYFSDWGLVRFLGNPITGGTKLDQNQWIRLCHWFHVIRYCSPLNKKPFSSISYSWAINYLKQQGYLWPR